jgi:hypothetical protein
MKATISGLSAVLLALALTATAQAWFWFGRGHCQTPVNASSPSGSCPYPDGGGNGPSGNRPSHGGPFQGFHPPTPMGLGWQPFARSPRDYFMVDP